VCGSIFIIFVTAQFIFILKILPKFRKLAGRSGIESRWGRDFLHPSRPALGPNQPPKQWVPVLSGVKWTGRDVDHPLSSSAEVKERVELYIYSTSGPSWPVYGDLYLYLHNSLPITAAAGGHTQGLKPYFYTLRCT
jgi:hypothetical protein